MNKITTIIADDEPLAVKRIRNLLSVFENIQIIGEAFNGREALELIEKLRPDVVFLDVEMPVLNGFEVLKQAKFVPKVIFTTAFEEYAIRAFEENSIDYLLKPVLPERLEKAISKLERFTSNPLTESGIAALLEAARVKNEIRSFPVKIGDKILLIRIESIAYFEARDKYVYIITDDNREYITDFTLSSLVAKLPPAFLRVHRAIIISKDKIKEIHRGDSATFTITLTDKNNTRIHTGRSYADQVRSLLEL